MKKIVLIFSLVMLYSLSCFGQQCGNCKQTFSLANYDLDVQVAQPELQGEKTQGWLEWLQLFWVGKHANSTLFNNNKSCIRFTQPLDARISSESFETKHGIEVPPLIEESELIKVGQTYTNLPPQGDLSRFGNYITTGYVKKSGDGYVLHMEIQAACNRKTVASADVSFQPSFSSQNAINIGQQAAAQLSPLIEKIKQFEIRERQNDQKVALDGGLEDAIIIKPKKRNLAPGEQTELEISFKDCDGQPLTQREIVFTKGTLNGMSISSGTTGGTVTPATVITDGNGKTKATFKMGSAKTAIINAYHIFNQPNGCENVKLGSTPIGGIPVQVQVSYEQNETRTVKRGTLPGVDVEGGDEAERTNMRHTSILYHYPSPDAVKKGFLVEAAMEKGETDSKTVYVLESGRYDWSKNVQPANIFGKVGNQRVVMDTEEGSQTNFSGTASLLHPSEVLFHLGNANDSASFMWNIQYPAASGEDIAGGGASIVKGEEGVKWIVNRITDPNTPYKTEYLLKLTLNAAEEFRKGNKAMKELFGMDLDDMSNTIDPSKNHQNMAGASGYQTITVRILSPYGSK